MTTTRTKVLLLGALEQLEQWSPDEDHEVYTMAAAAGLLLAYIEQHELAFHPHDSAPITDSYGAPPELVEMVELHPELGDLWRQAMAAKQLARWIARGLLRDPAIARNGLVAIASAIGEPASHHDRARLVSGDHLAELAGIAVGEA